MVLNRHLRTALLTMWWSGLAPLDPTLAQTVSVLDTDKVFNAISPGVPRFVCFAVPPRIEDGLLYAPLQINVLVTNHLDLAVAQTNVFAGSCFLPDNEYQTAKQGLQEVLIPYDRRDRYCGPDKTVPCIQRWNHYIQVYNDHVLLRTDGVQTNLVGQWAGRVFGQGRTNKLIVATGGVFQLETYDADPSGRLHLNKSNGRLWATSSRLVLSHSAGRVQLFELTASNKSLTMREVGTQSFGGNSYAFTKNEDQITCESRDAPTKSPTAGGR